MSISYVLLTPPSLYLVLYCIFYLSLSFSFHTPSPLSIFLHINFKKKSYFFFQLGRKILFEGTSEEDQLTRILQCLGEPTQSDTYNALKTKSGYRMKHNAISNINVLTTKKLYETYLKCKNDIEIAVANELIASQEVTKATPPPSSSSDQSTDGIFDAAQLELARLSAAHKVATQKVKSARWAMKCSKESYESSRFNTLRNMFPLDGYDPRSVHADPNKPCSLSEIGFKTLCQCLEVDPTARCSASQV